MSKPIVLYLKLRNDLSVDFGSDLDGEDLYCSRTAEFQLRLEVDPESRTVLNLCIEMTSAPGYAEDLALTVTAVSVDPVAVEAVPKIDISASMDQDTD